jgi:anti-anti-sigma factor
VEIRGEVLVTPKGKEVSVLRLRGELTDKDGSEVLKEKLAELFSAKRFNIILDMSEVPFADSTGHGMLVRAHTSIYYTNSQHGGRLALLSTQKRLRSGLRLRRLTKSLKCFEDESEALASFDSPPHRDSTPLILARREGL